MSFPKALVIYLILIGIPYTSYTQTSYGGVPISLEKSSLISAKSQSIMSVSVGDVDSAALLQEDSTKGLNRFAKGVDVSIDLGNAANWTDLANGDRLWRVRLQSGNALGLSILFKDFYLPATAQLYVYSSDGTQVKGSYTHLNNKESGKFMAGVIHGTQAVIEYYEPKAVRGKGRFEIYKVFKVYDGGALKTNQPSTKAKLQPKDFGDAANCHINSNCPEAADWQLYKKGVARIIMVFEDAMGFCTGTLMNNVKEDGTPYILSANHCSDGADDPLFEHWQFDFNYEAPTCDNPSVEPSAQSIQGCTFKAGRAESDFVLLEIDEAIPTSFDVRYHGWDRSENVPDTAIMMHHPQGDIMKYSSAAGDIRIFPNSINWDIGVKTPPNHHFVTNLKEGAFETGSSGAAFINQDGRVIGQFNGGTAACEDAESFFGRLAVSWDNGAANNSLQPYLDPDNTGALSIDEMSTDALSVTISGIVRSAKGVEMESVTVTLSGDTSQTSTTDSDGRYTFTNLSGTGSYIITPTKTTKHFDGISTGDMVILRKDILGIEPLSSPALYLAADVTNNENVSTGDMLLLQRLILGIVDSFPSNTSWRFYTSDYPTGLSQPNPFIATSTAGSLDQAIIVAPGGSITDLDFVGVKVGDPSLSVNPNQ